MAKVGIFYGSTTGVTEDIANRIAEKLMEQKFLTLMEMSMSLKTMMCYF